MTLNPSKNGRRAIDNRSKARGTGLVLAGGGARGAYQVGALKAITQMLPDGRNPFPIITGVSVGAINAGALASRADNFHEAVGWLEGLWGNLRAHQVYRTDFPTITRSGLHWMATVFLGGLGTPNPRFLLDTDPLARLIEREVDFARIGEVIDNGDLEALAVTASSYATGRGVTFFQGRPELEEWDRARRSGVRATITREHLMASSALPVVFDSVPINGEYFGEGALRLAAPLSPAIRLGAEKILVISVRDEQTSERRLAPNQRPTLGDVGGALLDTLFHEYLKSDIERMERINQTLDYLSESEREEVGLRPIETHVLRPSVDVRDYARDHAHELPRAMQTLLRGIGAWGPNWQTTSYLLFEKSFCRALMELGYRDTLNRREEISRFLGLPAVV